MHEQQQHDRTDRSAQIPAPEAPLVALRGVTKRFGTLVANDAVSLEILPGETLGLLGENGAGKSTLMNVLYGLYRPDGGSIEVGGRPVEIDSPRRAMELGIGMVHQHFMLVPDMTVAENIALGLRAGWVRGAGLAKVAARVTELSELYGLEVDPERVVESLSVGEKQRVEIVKALYRGADVLILDEPTAVLTPGEWAHLLEVVRRLNREGKAVVLITHKLGEICEAVDRCVVLRDGRYVGAVGKDGLNQTDLARLMVGRDVALRAVRPPADPGPVVLGVRDVSLVEADGRAVLDALSLEVRAGEVLGVAGVDGNGQRELVDVLTGLRAPSSGSIAIGDRDQAGWGPDEFVAAGGAVIPEERQRSGAAITLPIADNLLLRVFRGPPFARRGVQDRGAIKLHAAGLIERFGVRAQSPDMPMRQLSGGNQQKVVLARELSREPKLLVAAQPTRGLDVGAMEFVYETINDHKRGGGATLLISTELDELLSLADRITVLYEGRSMGTFATEDVTVEHLGLLMAGGEAP